MHRSCGSEVQNQSVSLQRLAEGNRGNCRFVPAVPSQRSLLAASAAEQWGSGAMGRIVSPVIHQPKSFLLSGSGNWMMQQPFSNVGTPVNSDRPRLTRQGGSLVAVQAVVFASEAKDPDLEKSNAHFKWILVIDRETAPDFKALEAAQASRVPGDPHRSCTRTCR